MDMMTKERSRRDGPNFDLMDLPFSFAAAFFFLLYIAFGRLVG